MRRLFLFFVLALTASAQFDRGRISGYLRDPSGAFVPNANVQVVNESTGVAVTANSNEAGYYQVPNLFPGMYTVAAEANGFKRTERTHVRLDAGMDVAADVAMQVGAAAESVTVVASASGVQADTAQLGRTVDAKQLEALSLNGENPLDLIYTKPGVVGSAVDGFDWATTTMKAYVNGIQRDKDVMTVDGALAIRTRGHQANLGVLGADMVQEAQILTSGLNAEYGRGGGGHFRFVTKSGTQQFHGDLSEFLQNSAFNANTWSRNRSGVASQANAPAQYTFNQFGFTIGGPVYIPHKFNSDRNKLFFFVGEEWSRFRQTLASSATVPTAAERTGNFSELLTSNPVYGSAKILKDPTTGTPFPGNIIPVLQQSPNGMAMLNAFPLPTPGYQNGSNNWTSTNGQPANQHKTTIRVDYNLSSTEALSFRGSLWGQDQLDAFSDATDHVRRHTFNIGDTSVISLLSTISPTMVNELSFSANKDSYTNQLSTDTPVGGLRTNFNITYPLIYPNNKQIPQKIPTIDISNFSLIDGTSSPLHSAGPIYELTDNVTKVKGNHTIKFGVLLDRSGENNGDQISGSAPPGGSDNQNGDFQFRDSTTGGTGLALGNAALGRFDSYAEFGQKNYTIYRSNSFDLFIQDGWKVTPRLRLEFGVRYNYWPMFYSEWNNFAEFRPTFYNPATAPVVSKTTGLIVSGSPYDGIVLPGCGWPSGAQGRLDAASDPQFNSLFHCLDRSLNPTPKDVFEPRFGLAYALNGKTALRAAIGEFHYRMLLDDSNQTGSYPPVQAETQVVAGSADNPGAGGAVANPIPAGLEDPNRKIDTSFNWNVTVERELPGAMTLEVAYVGTRAFHLLRQININSLLPGTLQANPGVAAAALRPYQGLGTIIESSDDGGSHYNSLQVQLQRRFSNGLGFSAAYSWAKSIDSASARYSVLFNAFNDKGYIGPSDFDRTHVLVLNSVYEIPLLKGNTSWAGKLLGRWELTSIAQFQTGTPLWVTNGTDIAGISTGNGDQPWNVVGSPSVSNPQFSNSNSDPYYYFNPKAFAVPVAGTFGNAGRNSLRTVGSINWDGGLRKDFRITEVKRFQFRWELFNLMNHPNWSDPNTNPTSGSFGKVQSKTGNRSMQFALKFYF
jgi:hypothetical protein